MSEGEMSREMSYNLSGGGIKT